MSAFTPASDPPSGSYTALPINRRSLLERRFSRLLLLLLAMALLGFSYYVVVRPWHMRWGATETERVMPLPGDRFIPPGAIVSTRAITINAPPQAVWPWLMQIGQGRAGFYSHDWLENLFAARMENVEVLDPSIPPLQIGDQVSMQHDGPALTVSVVEPERALAFDGWTLYLHPQQDGTTRLIVRYPFAVGESLWDKVYYYAIFEEWHFVMETGMMLGIKQRAEAHGEQSS
ncbi:MAG: hypothetical protein JNJ78_22460 [Anaerolineae bacterium]|nr:hypothetical protein [Anaerolineae bacterium]